MDSTQENIMLWLDLEKAYDNVNWTLVHQLLYPMHQSLFLLVAISSWEVVRWLVGSELYSINVCTLLFVALLWRVMVLVIAIGSILVIIVSSAGLQ